MNDELRTIEATAGPYARQRLTVSAKEAQRAISEGWAVDPYAAPAEAKEITDEERQKILDAANTGAQRLRGELTEEKPEAEAAKPESHSEHTEPRGPGRPRKA